MTTFLYAPQHRAWLILIAATVLGYIVGTGDAIGFSAGLATLMIAYLKARMVLLDFMELRHAPRTWRFLLEGWLAALTLLLLAVYGAAFT
ncbi:MULTISPECIES: cytochrome C oxidase subunit IV family protein [Pseudomonas]|uniref:cytochrome C oxidase subunit IV family protein n=1 Tax=Pseudomonas TaxID=286 RepID=UPI00093DDADB|nr:MULTISPECIES: cytochrome C oxidase subunit IV family protein [Pseudomonas]MDH0639341.1 cytochrome C oxidase subunit IV family protein [Pseudomonas sp. GD03860]